MTDYTERVKIYDRVLARNGMLLQSVVALEELSECQKEICKILRGEGNWDHLAEEVADAIIMLEQIQNMYHLNKQVNEYMDKKLVRLRYRLKLERCDDNENCRDTAL